MYTNAFSVMVLIEQLYEHTVVILPQAEAQRKALTHHLFIENLYKQILEVSNGLTLQQEATILSQYQDTIDQIYQHFQVVRQGPIRHPERSPNFVLVNMHTGTILQPEEAIPDTGRE
jgi:hypothetical protein